MPHPQVHACIPLCVSIKKRGKVMVQQLLYPIHHTITVYTRRGVNFHASALKLHITISYVAKEDHCDNLNTVVMDKCECQESKRRRSVLASI
jgi:hypothetical protein